MSEEQMSEGNNTVCRILTGGAYVSGAVLALVFLGALMPARHTHGVPASRRLDKQVVLQGLEPVTEPASEAAHCP
ncbi:MAG: hypothetical protein FJ279_31960 [Planctomycetes bacterium]|nr:hypothetical protein [Planctomycetota bacterium]